MFNICFIILRKIVFMINKSTIFLVIFFSCCLPKLRSQIVVTGNITDSLTREPLIGVTIAVKGSVKATSTDLDGKFVLNNIKGGDVLIFSFVGYKEISRIVSADQKDSLLIGNIRLSPSGLLLREVEINSSVISANEETKVPTAVSTISEQEINEQMGAAEFPEILNSTPGVYSSMMGGGYGDGTFVLRGYGSQNTAVLINGVPVNDMENGTVYWSNWGALNQITRSIQVQRGLGFSKLGVSSIGGTMNVLIKPAEMYKGVSVQYSRSNLAFQDAVSVNASTGLMKNCWAITAAGGRRWGNSYRKGVYTDAWNYFLSVYKRIGKKHQLIFTGLGAPQTHGSGWDATQAQYETYGYIGDSLHSKTTYNGAWGYYDGKVKNRSVNHFHKPQFILNHYWDINEKITFSSAVYWSFGRGGGLNLQRSYGAPSLSGSTYIDANGQLLWDSIYALNQRNIETNNTNEGTVTGARSKYYFEDRVNNHNWYGAFVTLRSQITDKFLVIGGFDGRYYQGTHYGKVSDLLGGDYIIDKDPFRKMPDGDYADMNMNNPDRVARQGDIVRYYYKGTVNWLGAFAQAEYNYKHFDFFLTGNFSRTSFYREGVFNHELFAYNGIGGEGKSITQVFYNYTVKGGINYRINGKHNVFVNAGYINRAPFLVNAYIDPQVSAQTMDKLISEEIRAAEAGYMFRSSFLSANLNVYYTERKHWMYTESFSSPEYEGNFVNFITSDVNATHQGIEFDFKLKPLKKLDITGMCSIGDWRWKNNPVAIVRDDNTLNVDTTTQVIYIRDMPVGNAPQTTAGLGARYQLPWYSYVGVQANYFDNLYMDYNPSIRSNPNGAKQIKMQAYYLLSAYAGMSYKIKKWNHYIRLRININNLLNNVYLTQGRESMSSGGVNYYYQFGRPRTYNISISYNL